MLDFMLVASPPSFLPSSSSSFSSFFSCFLFATTTIYVQCSLPDLNSDHPHPVFMIICAVFPAGPQLPQLQPSMPSVPCRTSTAITTQCSLPDLHREHPCPQVCQTQTCTCLYTALTLVWSWHWFGHGTDSAELTHPEIFSSSRSLS